MTAGRRRPLAVKAGTQAAGDAEQLIDYCSRPTCRQPFNRVIAPGRRREYCSPICRRAAEKELRQVQARLAHLESVVEKLRIDVAAFGKEEGAASPRYIGDGLDAQALSAMNRVAAILEYAPDPDAKYFGELRTLYQAVAPLLELDGVAAAQH
ncbi:MAG: hypothetical protein WDN27_06355 [Candidatus Saccharibacteria bacterium]